MSDFHVNGDDHETLAREKSLAILAAMTKETHDDDWVKTVLLPTIARFVKSQTEPLKDEIATLKTQVAALEERGIKFVGTYQRAQTYSRGDCCTFDGGMWVATCDTPPQEVPGKSVCWQLSVKSPRDPRQPTTGVGR